MSLPERIQFLVDAVTEGKKLSAKAMGELGDYAKDAEDKRLKADKEAAALKADETLVKTAVMAALRKADVRVIGGAKYRVEVKRDDVPQVHDWPAFYEHIRKTKSFDLLERRPGKAAVKARWDDGKQVPGVTKFPVDKLSFSKLS